MNSHGRYVNLVTLMVHREAAKFVIYISYPIDYYTMPFYLFMTYITDGYYIYIETSSPNNEGDFASLISPKIVRTGDGSDDPLCFTFFYHMYGSDIGSLRLNFLPEDSAQQETLWSKTGEVGDVWVRGLIDINLLGSGWLIFEGVDGTGYRADIAIDDVAISNCHISGINIRLFY